MSGVQIIKQLPMYFSLALVLPSLRSKYFPQHPVLKYPQCSEIGLCEIKRKVPTLVSALLDSVV
jgi:hypothetical protein